VVTFGPKADFAQNYLRKGKLVYIEGRLRTRDWTDNQNVRHFRTEVRADEIQFLERSGDAQGGGAPQYGNQAGGGRPQRSGPTNEPAPDYGPDPGDAGDYLEDDIPF